MRILREPGGETGGGNGAATETLEIQQQALIDKVFPELGRKEPAGETKQPAGKAPAGGTNDLSQKAGDKTPDAAAEQEAQELAERARQNGITPEEQAQAETDEWERLTQLAEESGKTIEEIQAEEAAAEDEANGAREDKGKTGDPDKRLNKRIGKLLEKNQQLEEELTALKAGAGRATQQPGVLENINKPEQLAELRESQEETLEQVETLLTTLSYAPARVEKQLRGMAAANPAVAAKFKNEAGEEDFSAERIAEVLTTAKADARAVLKAIPARQQLLTQRTAVSRLVREPEVTKVAPFIADADSEDHAQWRGYLNASRDLQNSPMGELLAAALVLGLKQLTPATTAAASRGRGAPARNATQPAAAAKPGKRILKLPNVRGTGGAAKTGLSAAKEKFARTRKESDLETVLAGMGM